MVHGDIKPQNILVFDTEPLSVFHGDIKPQDIPGFRTDPNISMDGAESRGGEEKKGVKDEQNLFSEGGGGDKTDEVALRRTGKDERNAASKESSISSDRPASDVREGEGQNCVSQYVAKVTDFGYSTYHTGDENQRIAMPISWPWHAPERANSPFAVNLTAAKKMDSYSFGLVCAWLLFYNYRCGEKRVFLDDFNPETQPPIPLDSFLSSSTVPQAQVNALRELFTMTLGTDPDYRSINFKRFVQLLGRERYTLSFCP